MLHILFLILKIIGIILAVILGLILLIVCIVLFVPICYKADLHGNGNARELTVHARVSWLFGLIKAVFSLENGKPDLYIRIAWKKLGGSEPESKKETETKQTKVKQSSAEVKPVLTDAKNEQEHQMTQREENRNETKSETAEAEHQETGTVEKVEKVSAPAPEKIPAESRISERTEKQSEQSAKIHEESTEKKRRKKEDRKENRKDGQQNDSDAGSKIEQITEKIKCTYDKFCDKINEITEKKDKISEFLTNETHKSAFLKLKKEIIRLLKRLIPKKIQGDIVFGFEDPSWTGKLLAWISMIYPWIGEHMDITPDFEYRTLSGDLQIRGRLQVITPIVTAVRLILSKAVRRSFKDIRNFKL